jgi:predicted nucleotidyltransferase
MLPLMSLPQAKARLLNDVAAALAGVPHLEAVALGGSHARGAGGPQSDLDIGLYYREAETFGIEDIQAIARRFSASGEPTVTGFYEWGPFVNGGAWIDNSVCKIDFLYRNLDQLVRIVEAAERGEWTHDFDQQPPFGFRSVTTLGEIHVCRPLHDPRDVLAPLKARVAVFPPALRSRIVQDALWGADFSFQFARNFAASGDVPNTVACMTRIVHYLVQVLFALNETYFVNDKRALDEIEEFAAKPVNFGARVSAILAAPGASPNALRVSLDALKKLFAEVVSRTNGAYEPRFAAP